MTSQLQKGRHSPVDRRIDNSARPTLYVAADHENEAAPLQASRRRHIDPTTCERDYSADEVEFMQALDQYKRSHRRMFPTCSEILEVLRELGYVKVSE
jgi:hypothetical protein